MSSKKIEIEIYSDKESQVNVLMAEKILKKLAKFSAEELLALDDAIKNNSITTLLSFSSKYKSK